MEVDILLEKINSEMFDDNKNIPFYAAFPKLETQ